MEADRQTAAQPTSGHSPVGVAPSRKDIFVTTAGETLTVWAIDDKGLLGRDLGHKAAATALAFSPDGQTLFSGDEVGTG